jgi:hypothetical protein
VQANVKKLPVDTIKVQANATKLPLNAIKVQVDVTKMQGEWANICPPKRLKQK